MQSHPEGYLAERLADEAARIYRTRKANGEKRPNMKSCLMEVVRNHRLDRFSCQSLIEECLSKMGRILGKRGARKCRWLRAHGLLQGKQTRRSSETPRRFSEFLFPVSLRPKT